MAGDAPLLLKDLCALLGGAAAGRELLSRRTDREISMRRISSAVGVRPTPYVGDCANAGLPRSSRIVTSLSEPIGHAPVLGDLPGHNAVVEPGHSVISLHRHVPPLGDLLSQRLHLPDLVGGARKNLGRVSIPSPLIAEPDVRHALWCRLE